ncbi:MAG: hypothetical protein LBG69_00035 [Zoogloeaceae bacterium]|nr:hypothetical protein [Zoogloeaceae bacterium]
MTRRLLSLLLCAALFWQPLSATAAATTAAAAGAAGAASAGSAFAAGGWANAALAASLSSMAGIPWQLLVILKKSEQRPRKMPD